jgi:hypothetical protein
VDVDQDLGDRTVTALPHVLLQALPDDESVLLNSRTEGYFGLDRMGTRMYQALVGSPSVAEAEAALLAEFEVDAATLRSDLRRFVQDLVDRELVDVSGA